MNTRDAATVLGVTPKALRRHLRTHSDWSSVGIGGTYTFTDADIRRLRKQLVPDHNPRNDDGYKWMNEDLGIVVEVMLAARNDPRLRGMIRARRRARRQKLGQQMLDFGIITPANFERNYR